MQENQETVEMENQEENDSVEAEQSSQKEIIPEEEEQSNSEDEFDGEEIEPIEADDEDLEDDEADDGEYDNSIVGADILKRPHKTIPTEEDLRLSWLVDDFEGVTENIYEAINVAAYRARQIGRRQKQEIDSLNSSMEVVDLINNEEEEGLEPGVDHFHHMKPTVQALKELKKKEFVFSYLEDVDDEEEL